MKSFTMWVEQSMAMGAKPDYLLVKTRCVEMGIKFPEIVACQAILETGYFSSSIYEVNHNLFGIKNHKNTPYCIQLNIRPDSIYVDSVLRKVDMVHCFYLDQDASFADYKEYQEHKIVYYEQCTHTKITTGKQYLDFLEDIRLKKYGCYYHKKFRYAEDPYYVQKLTKLLRKYEKANYHIIINGI